MNGWHNEEQEAPVALAYGLTLYPPAAVCRRLRLELRERGISGPGRFHLSLKYPFYPNRDLREAWEQMARLVAAVPRLHLRSDGLLASSDTYCHLLLIAHQDELIRLHNAAMDLFGSSGDPVSQETAQFEGRGFNPHLTVAYGACDADFELHDMLLGGYAPEIEFEMRSVDLVECRVRPDSGPAERRLLRSLPFGELPATSAIDGARR